MDDRVLLIRSDQSNNLFPNNSPYNFRVRLSNPLILEEECRIALLDYYSNDKITGKKDNRHELYLFCDVCSGDTTTFNNQFCLLRRIFPAKQNNWNYIFNPPIYLPLKKNEIFEIEFHIKDETGNDALFLTQPISMTIHLKKNTRYGF